MAITLKHQRNLSARASSRLRRQIRGRKKINGTAERPRLVVTKSAKHLSVQGVGDRQVLATHWQISADRSIYRYRINPNARWSDGQGLMIRSAAGGFSPITSALCKSSASP